MKEEEFRKASVHDKPGHRLAQPPEQLTRDWQDARAKEYCAPSDPKRQAGIASAAHEAVTNMNMAAQQSPPTALLSLTDMRSLATVGEATLYDGAGRSVRLLASHDFPRDWNKRARAPLVLIGMACAFALGILLGAAL